MTTPPAVSYSVAVADPNAPTHVLKPNADGSINVDNVDVTISDVSVDNANDYEAVAAGQTAQVLGTTGAVGDRLVGLLVTPGTTSPGAVTILDNSTSIVVFAGGALSVPNLVPFFLQLGAKSVNGAWKVTTGTNVTCVAVGTFT